MTTMLDAGLASPDTLAGPLADIADELTAAGYTVHEPGGIKITNARGALCDLTITTSGLLTWEYHSLEGNHVNPAQLTAIVRRLLDPECPGTAAIRCHADGSPKNAVGKAAIRHGLQASLCLLDTGTGSGETYEELAITNPASPERGTVRVTDDGALYWECHTSHRDGALPGADIATALAQALTAAGHAATGWL